MPKRGNGNSRDELSFGILASSQNLLLEIESMEKELATLPAPGRNEALSRKCRETLARVKRSARTPWRIIRSYYIFTSLQWINQQLFHLREPEQLRVHWLILRDRLYALNDTERGEWTKARLDRIESSLAKDKTTDSKKLRSQLFALRKLLDEKVALSLWQIRQIKSALISLIVLLVLLLSAVGYAVKDVELTGGPLVISSSSASAAPAANTRGVQLAAEDSIGGGATAPKTVAGIAAGGGTKNGSPLLLQTILITSLGATLSSLMSLITGDKRPLPPFMNRYIINMMRPLIGAAAGLFFYFLAFSGWLTIQPHPIAYFAFAFVFGFSERLFGKSIQAVASAAESNVNTYGASAERGSADPSTAKSK